MPGNQQPWILEGGTQNSYFSIQCREYLKQSYYCSLTFGKVALMYESWDDMAVIEVEVFMGTKDVGRYYTGEHTSMLLMVCPAERVQNMLGYVVCLC